MTEPSVQLSSVPFSRSLRAPLTLAGLAIGLALGIWRNRTGSDVAATIVAVLSPLGRLWLNALTMTVVPLIFGLLVTGVVAARTHASAGAAARRALFWFAGLLLLSCAAAAIVAPAVFALVAPAATPIAVAGTAARSWSVADWIAGLAPANPIAAAAGTEVVQIVVFALLFGLALTRIADRLRDAMLRVMEALVQSMLVIVDWVLWAAPLGVLALGTGVGVRLGTGAVASLLGYILAVALCCLAAAALAAILAMLVGRIAPQRFLRAAFPAQAVALGTQSSLASLPAMIGAAPALGVGRDVAGVVLPLAVSVFRASSAAANMAVAIYLAHVHGVALGVPALAVGAATAAVVSVAAVGLSAQISFFATIVPVCTAMGVPIEMLPILLAVETVPDLFRTLGNVTADLAVVRLTGGRDPS